MLTFSEVIEELKEYENNGGTVVKIHITTVELDNNEGFQIYLNVFRQDKYKNEDFHDYVLDKTYPSFEKTESNVSQMVSQLEDRGYNALYKGLEN